MRHHTADQPKSPPLPEHLCRYVREHPPQLSPEQEARKATNLANHARLRPVYDESTYQRLMRSNVEEIRREIVLMERGGAPEHQFSIHRRALADMIEQRIAKYGRASVEV